MREEVLETSRFPTICFEGSAREPARLGEGMFRMKIGGKLNLHGVERDIEFPCNVTGGERSLAGQRRFLHPADRLRN